MAEQVEITDLESASAWLETQDHQTQVWFAARSALRVFPALGNWEHSTSSALALSACRATLISVAASTCPAAEMKELETDSAYSTAQSSAYSAAYSARSAAHSARSAAHSAAYSAAYSARSAALSAHSADHSGRSVHSAAQSAAYSASSAAVWVAATKDTGAPTSWMRLWHGEPPDDLAKVWNALKAQWQMDGADWSFWIEWYEGILDGNPIDWRLIFQIATELSDGDWGGGQARVAERIVEIRVKHEVARLAHEISETGSLAQPGSPGIGHNNPPPEIAIDPPSIEDDGIVAQPPETIIWVAANELRTQAEAREPDKSRVQKAVEILIAVLTAAGKWTWEKFDKVVDAAAGAFGKAFGATGGVAGVAYLMSNQDKLIELANAGLKWLQLLP